MMTWYRALAILTLFGCATNTSRNSRVEPECSFRAPTSCWTLGARFPNAHHTARPQQNDSLIDSPPLLAVKSDGATAR